MKGSNGNLRLQAGDDGKPPEATLDGRVVELAAWARRRTKKRAGPLYRPQGSDGRRRGDVIALDEARRLMRPRR